MCGTSAKLIQCNSCERIRKINTVPLSEIYETMINVAASSCNPLVSQNKNNYNTTLVV